MQNRYITKEQARLQGLTRFYTGVPCKAGHIADRLVSKNCCIECKRIRERKNKNKREYEKQRYIDNRDYILSKVKTRRIEKKDIISEYQQKWRLFNKDKTREYRKENKHLYAHHAALRRKKVRQATPPWADLEKIKEIYRLAAEKTSTEGVKYEVDHIIPISNSIVSGLHWEGNLQIISKKENNKKSNTIPAHHPILAGPS
jgi:hypothetical protein